MKLSELQRAFVAATLQGGTLAVQGGGTLSPQAALGVYTQGYFARLTEALGETYEGVWSVLGDKDFFAACRAFIAENKSSFYNLSDYGRGFGGFLKKRPESKEFPFLQELCEFEWLFKELFHKKEHQHAPASALAEAAESSRFIFGQAVAFRRHKHSVYAIWKERQSRKPLPRSVWEKPEQLLVYKKDGEIFVKTLPMEELRVLERLGSGSSLADALAPARLDPRRARELFSVVAESGIVKRVN